MSRKGELAVYKSGMFGEKKVLWLNIVYLEFQTWTDTVRTGGGYIGGGFGAKGAAEGMLEATVLNALTSRSREYTLLGAFTFPPGGASRRDVVFGFRGVDETELRKQVATAVPTWAEEFLGQLLKKLEEPLSQDKVAGTYREIDRMLSRGILTADQHSRVEATLVKKGPREGPPPGAASTGPDRVSQLKTLADLRASGALTEDEFQAEKLRLLGS